VVRYITSPVTGKQVPVVPAMEDMTAIDEFFADHPEDPFGPPGPDVPPVDDVNDPEFGPEEN
jgi:hypothetical protein